VKTQAAVHPRIDSSSSPFVGDRCITSFRLIKQHIISRREAADQVVPSLACFDCGCGGGRADVLQEWGDKECLEPLLVSWALVLAELSVQYQDWGSIYFSLTCRKYFLYPAYSLIGVLG
jgi:hypothetical protein